MKLKEIKMDMEVKVIRVKGEVGPEEHYIGKKGKVVSITTKIVYPIEVDFGYKTGVFIFKPEELVEV